MSAAAIFRVAWVSFLVAGAAGFLWSGAAVAQEADGVRVELHDQGVSVVNLETSFYAPYTVEPGETFESISTKFYGTPDFAAHLAAARGLPAVHIPLAGSIVYILAQSIELQFDPDATASQRAAVEDFIRKIPLDAQLYYKWAQGYPALEVTPEGEQILTSFDVAGMLIMPYGQEAPTLELQFSVMSMLDLIMRGQWLEDVSVQSGAGSR